MAEYICPHCKRPIYDPDALLCHFCGESLQRAGEGFISRIRYSNQKALWFFLVFAVLFVFILLFVR
jgi:hypothetical protein